MADMEKTRKPVRVWVDGCFDMFHYGHANALRQAKEMGDYLVVGIHSDAEIMKHKGIPVMHEHERYAAVAACKWVDEIVPDAPYTTQLAMIEQYQCDFVVHGDDIVTDASGRDSYYEVKQAGKFKECKRTIGVSTTNLVGRMLLLSRDNNQASDGALEHEKEDKRPQFGCFSLNGSTQSPYTGLSQMLPSNKRIVQFSSVRELKPSDRVVYVDGDFDLFHIGHIELLRQAKQLGDYLLVGVHDDETCSNVKGSNFPLMNLQERVLSVLACRYVDEVIIGAPYSITSNIMNMLYNPAIVVHGSTTVVPDSNGRDPYEFVKSLGIYRVLETKYSHLTTRTIIDRIVSNRIAYEERNRKKEAKEVAELQNQRSN